MKTKILLLSTITLILAACGGSTDTADTSATTVASAPAAPVKTGGELLIAKADCAGCHHKENKLIGPAFQAIAEKYPSNEENINLPPDKRSDIQDLLGSSIVKPVEITVYKSVYEYFYESLLKRKVEHNFADN